MYGTCMLQKENTNEGTVLLRSFCRPFGYGQPPDYILCTSSSPGQWVTRLKDKEGLRASLHTPYLLTGQNTSTWSALTLVPGQYKICSLIPRFPLTVMTTPSKVYNTVVLSLSIETEPVVLYTETRIDWESLVCLSTFDSTHPLTVLT